MFQAVVNYSVTSSGAAPRIDLRPKTDPFTDCQISDMTHWAESLPKRNNHTTIGNSATSNTHPLTVRGLPARVW